MLSKADVGRMDERTSLKSVGSSPRAMLTVIFLEEVGSHPGARVAMFGLIEEDEG